MDDGGSRYSAQDRGSLEAYSSYFEGMDKSMRQKIALVASYFPHRGTIADMGCGSGSGSFDLASLYPGVDVVGVDINPTSVRMASERYRRPNLRFEVGDIAARVFEPGTLDAVFNSSVLHHVTSFNDFRVDKVCELLDRQIEQLRVGGVLAIRDFLCPERGDQTVSLALPLTDGGAAGASDDVAALSSAALFERFAAGFRCAWHPAGGVPFGKTIDSDGRTARFEVSHRLAVEFVLRKDYRTDWAAELLEEYLYFTQSEFERAFRERGLRILVSKPIYNPWIVRHRFHGRFELRDGSGAVLPFPATNYLIVGEKVDAGAALRVWTGEDTGDEQASPGYLRIEHWVRAGTGQIWDLVSRPNPTIDLIPWLERDGELFVVARQGYPRPLTNAAHADAPLDESRTSGFVLEPLAAVTAVSGSLGQAALDTLIRRTGLSAGDVLGVEPGLGYFPSPGGIDERVRSVFVRLKPEARIPDTLPRASGFSTSGTMKRLSVLQTLRAYHVGGMFDSRLEINLHHLLRGLGRSPGPWLGAEPVALDRGSTTDSGLVIRNVAEWQASKRTVFAKSEVGARFLSVYRANCREESRDGMSEGATLEYVVPRTASTNTVALVPILRSGARVLLGLEERDLPVAQIHHGTSRLLTLPAWRMPRGLERWDAAQAFATDRLAREFGVRAVELSALGGAYYPSLGLTPESVMLAVATVEPASVDFATSLPSQAGGALQWFALDDLIDHRALIEDGHLLTAIFRLAQALGGL